MVTDWTVAGVVVVVVVVVLVVVMLFVMVTGGWLMGQVGVVEMEPEMELMEVDPEEDDPDGQRVQDPHGFVLTLPLKDDEIDVGHEQIGVVQL